MLSFSARQDRLEYQAIPNPGSDAWLILDSIDEAQSLIKSIGLHADIRGFKVPGGWKDLIRRRFGGHKVDATAVACLACRAAHPSTERPWFKTSLPD